MLPTSAQTDEDFRGGWHPFPADAQLWLSLLLLYLARPGAKLYRKFLMETLLQVELVPDLERNWFRSTRYIYCKKGLNIVILSF